MTTTLAITVASVASLTALTGPSTLTTSYIYAAPTYTTNDNTSGSAINNNDGASGSDAGAWSLSHGAIVAIAVVVALVAAFGIASTVLYFVAKKRQWEVRKSLVRVSKRLTGRDKAVQTKTDAERRSRRHGTMTLDSTALLKPGLIRVEKDGMMKAPAATQIEMKTSPQRKWKVIRPPSFISGNA